MAAQRSWGSDDQLGALNLSTPETVLRALATPRTGRVFSIAHKVGREAPVQDRKHPTWHTTTVREAKSGCVAADDLLIMHSHSGTHIDALSHYWRGDTLYNGWPSGAITSEGAPHLSIDRVSGFVLRCLLLDLSVVCPTGKAGHGFEITLDHIEEAVARTGSRIEAGDAILLRTGWVAQYAVDKATYNWGEPGIGIDVAEFLAEQGVVLIGADNWGVEAVPPATTGEGLIVHRAMLNRFGVYLLENLELEELATDAGPGAYLLVVAPLRIRGGVGSPVNPLVMT
ncbi:cyclase family protein [Rhodococcus sp. NPDC059968]|uniref:cyclase family protein n=1 Tax=Rhodococcus sp. NPDC059968 TaxID=3347017 RepID=UPI0036705FD0